MLRQIAKCNNRDFLKGMFRVKNKFKRLVENLDILLHNEAPFAVAERSKEWVCGLSLAGLAGSNLASSMDICLL
jgi:hypothetical protein